MRCCWFRPAQKAFTRSIAPAPAAFGETAIWVFAAMDPSSHHTYISAREPILGRWVGWSALELHLLDVLISGHDFIANLHHHLEGGVRLLDRDHDRTHVAAAALQHVANLLFSARTQF